MRQVYLDNAAATPVATEVAAAMQPFLHEQYGNPGSLNAQGKQAKQAVDTAREKIARLLGAQPHEIIFTGSGTESINLALQGVKGKHLIVSAIEHHAVLHTSEALAKEGCRVTKIPVDKDGIVDVAKVEAAITPDTALISVMYANNEIGTIQPIRKISEIAKKHKVLFHTDACQAAGLLPLHELGVDLMTLNASKMYGPKGVGVLYVKHGTRLKPLIHGGEQEFGLRSGTENVPGIVGMAKALELAEQKREEEVARLTALREKLIAGLLAIPETRLNGDKNKRLANNVHVSFKGVEAESLLLFLEERGIDAATGSACTSTKITMSHVLKALHLPYAVAHGSIRFTLGRQTTAEDIEYTINTVKELVAQKPLQWN